MIRSIVKKSLMPLATAGLVFLAAAPAQAAPDSFEIDVGTSINLGLGFLDANGVYNNPSNAGDAAGLTLLALLEKRASGIATDPPQGYDGANAADKARMRRVIRYIIDRVNATGAGFYSYRDGGFMMALSLYMRTGGVDKDDGPTTELDGAPLTLIQALNMVFDRTIANQRKTFTDDQNGYWCYVNNGCRDASTTQLTLSGLAGARAIYSPSGFAPDAARNAELDAATLRSQKAYALNGNLNPFPACGQLPNEEGHGYNTGDQASIQQTASGIWAQLLGGSDLNNADVQAYLRWVYNRYRYSSPAGGVDAFWGTSHWYYLWTATKAFEFIDASGVVAGPGKLDPDDLGTLPPASAPACALRQEHRNPNNDVRVPLFGPGGAGFYDEDEDWYYDFAYSILSYQCATGQYACNGAPGRWNFYAEQAYAILVLQRSVGGGCIDTDGDGACDDVDNCVNDENPNQGDRDDDGVGDVCDNCPDTPNPGQEDSNNNGVGDACEGGLCDLDKDSDVDSNDVRMITAMRGQRVPPASPDADPDGNRRININDARACALLCTRAKCATQ